MRRAVPRHELVHISIRLPPLAHGAGQAPLPPCCCPRERPRLPCSPVDRWCASCWFHLPIRGLTTQSVPTLSDPLLPPRCTESYSRRSTRAGATWTRWASECHLPALRKTQQRRPPLFNVYSANEYSCVLGASLSVGIPTWRPMRQRRRAAQHARVHVTSPRDPSHAHAHLPTQVRYPQSSAVYPIPQRFVEPRRTLGEAPSDADAKTTNRLSYRPRCAPLQTACAAVYLQVLT